jgi:uncharacterized membrane protein YgcG
MGGEGGPVLEKCSIGSFGDTNEARGGICYYRSLMNKKQNICFSFDPKTLLCSSCSGKEPHPVGGEGEGGERQVFVLSDQNFPASLPCEKGSCLKIIRIENGTLNELVSCLLDLTRGRGIPTGSVILLCSASHLQMRGVGGYMDDLRNENERLMAISRGGVICLSGIPVLSGGCSDSTAIRAVLELGNWLKLSGEQFLRGTWAKVQNEIHAHGKGGTFITEKFRHDMPPCLANNEARSWVSGGWATPCGVRPLTAEAEQKIVQTLTAELNDMYNLGLDSDPNMNTVEKEKKSVKYLVIGGSHAKREGQILVERGYEVLACAVGGWRPNKTAGEEMAVQVEAALQLMSEDDVIVVHCFDNIAYMARSEEGGDLPIRRFPNGEFHVEGDLALAGKARLHMFFRNCLPFLRLLEGRIVVFLTPLARYLLSSCCYREDHAPNRQDEEFGEQLQKGLQDCRNFFKDFLFTSGLRGFSVVNPSLCVPVEDERGEPLWGADPVHPKHEGYNRIVDFVCAEAERLAGKGSSKKRTTAQDGPPGKKPRTEVARPRWVDESPSSTTMRGGPARGSNRGRGNYDAFAYGRGGGRGGFNGGGGGGSGGIGEGGGRGRGRGWFNPGWRGRGR